MAYLNHGAYGACPRPVLARQQELREQLESEPVGFLARRLPAALEAVRREVAAYAGTAEPEHIVFLPNTTTALNAVARSVPLEAGDEVVVTDREYGAMLLVWEEIAKRRGARIVTAHVPLPATDTAELAESVWASVSGRTRVLFFSHVTSETAVVLPAAELCKRAREAGIWSVVDGAHVPGQLELALDRIGADCYAGMRSRAWPELRQRCRTLAQRTQTEVLELFGGEPLASPDLQAPQMAAFSVPHSDPERLQQELLGRFRIEVPARRVDGQTVVRLSVQAYTTDEDCGRLVQALIELAEEA